MLRTITIWRARRRGRFALIIAALSATVGLAACGGGHGVASPPLSAAAPTVPANRSVATFAIVVPPRSASAARRAPRYISPATRSIAITVDPRTANQANANQNITTGSPGCTTPTPISPLTCQISLALSTGSHTFDFRTYDGALDANGIPQGKVLSANLAFPFTVTAGRANLIGVTFQGVPSAVTLIPQPNQDVQGTQAAGFDLYGFYKADGAAVYPRSFTAVATDADGNFILGPGAPAVTVVSSDTSALSDGVSTAANPNLFTVTPRSYVPSSRQQLTVTATPSTAAGSDSGASAATATIPLTFVARNAPRIYVSDWGTNSGLSSIAVYDELGNRVRTNGGFAMPAQQTNPNAFAYDPHNGLLYVVLMFVNRVVAYDIEGNANAVNVDFAPFGATPESIAWDASRGHLLIGADGSGLFAMNEAGTSVQPPTGARWQVPANDPLAGGAPGYPCVPSALLVDQRSGTVFVSDSACGEIVSYDQDGNARSFINVAAAVNCTAGTFGLEQDPGTGDLYAVYAAGSNGAPVSGGNCPTTPTTYPQVAGVLMFDGAGGAVHPPAPFSIPSASQPFGIARSPGNGLLYVANQGAGIAAYDRYGNVVALGPGAFAGLSTPTAVVVVP